MRPSATAKLDHIWWLRWNQVMRLQSMSWVFISAFVSIHTQLNPYPQNCAYILAVVSQSWQTSCWYYKHRIMKAILVACRQNDELCLQSLCSRRLYMEVPFWHGKSDRKVKYIYLNLFSLSRPLCKWISYARWIVSWQRNSFHTQCVILKASQPTYLDKIQSRKSYSLIENIL